MKYIRLVSSKKLVAIFSIFGMVFGLLAPVITSAASITSAKDTMTRLKISTTADHTIVFTLPTGVTFDSNDELRIDFPHSSAFTQGGTWATADFTVNDGTSRTVNAVEATASPNGAVAGCSDGANNVGVEIDTTNIVFAIIPCGGSFVASSTAATVTFTIDGTTTDGTLTNPSSAASYTITIANDEDNNSTDDDTVSIAVGIADDDQVTVSATVNSSLTFDLDANTSGTGDTSAPYTVALGTITTTDTRVSGATDSVNRIMIDLDTNAASGVIVTVKNANGANGLVSTSTPADDIGSADGTIADGTENYGLCVISVTQTTGTLSKAAPYNSGSCSADTETNDIQALTTSGENIVSSAAPLAGGRAQIAVNAAISGVTPAHTDYADTLTFIATSTF